jgi:type IV secretion system protein VirD4
MKLLAPLAARYGYDVRIFAPGEQYSEVIDPLDFMENQEDAVTAAQIAQVINANAGGSGKGDEFFSKAADVLAKALIQLAKSSDCPDLAMVYCIQSTDDFINKLHAAVQAGRVSRWVAASFQQYLKAKDSEKTIASIDTTTVGIFSGFIQRSLLPSFIGKSTISTKLSGKQILIFKLDDPRRDVVGPFLATTSWYRKPSSICVYCHKNRPRYCWQCFIQWIWRVCEPGAFRIGYKAYGARV